MKYWTVLLVAVFLQSTELAANTIETEIAKDSDDHWIISYTMEQPVKTLTFKRSPDKSRSARWNPLKNQFTISTADGHESIHRKDFQPFSRITFTLTPGYVSLPKEYAPFSPFSDGGMLLHTGRFFVCVERCTADDNSWHFTLTAPAGDTIAVNGRTHQEKATWEDSDSGRKVYIGRQTARNDSHFLSVIDPGLPGTLRSGLAAQLPRLMNFFAEQLGEVGAKPMLFASYSPTEDGRYGQQGGVLPGQVFMHWYGDLDHIDTNPQHTLWFFAHEVAHIFQRSAGQIDRPEDAWIHEGSAEFLALLSLRELHPASFDYTSRRLQSAAESCHEMLSSHPLSLAHKRGKNHSHYNCGLLLQKAIHTQIKSTNPGEDIFTLWRAFENRVRTGATANSTTYLNVVKSKVPESFYDELKHFLSEDTDNLEKRFERLTSTGYTD